MRHRVRRPLQLRVVVGKGAKDRKTPKDLVKVIGAYTGEDYLPTLKSLGYGRVAVLTDGMAAWRKAGLPIEQGLSGVMNPPTDVLTMGTDRTWAEAIEYLRWEEELGKKYETHGTH